MREFLGRNGKCALCEKPLAGQRAFAHEKAGRIHLFCSFKPDLWEKWMQRVGLVPTPVEVEILDEKKDS